MRVVSFSAAVASPRLHLQPSAFNEYLFIVKVLKRSICLRNVISFIPLGSENLIVGYNYCVAESRYSNIYLLFILGLLSLDFLLLDQRVEEWILS